MTNHIAYIVGRKCILNLIIKDSWGMFGDVIIKNVNFTNVGV